MRTVVRVVLIAAGGVRALAMGGLGAGVGRTALDVTGGAAACGRARVGGPGAHGVQVEAAGARGGGSLRLRDATNIYYQTCFSDLVFPNVVASEGVAATIEPQMRQLFLEIILATAVLAGFGVLAVWWTPLHRFAGRALRERNSPKIFGLLKRSRRRWSSIAASRRRWQSTSCSRVRRICCSS